MDNYSDLMDALARAKSHELNVMFISLATPSSSCSRLTGAFYESTLCELFFNGDKEAEKLAIDTGSHLAKFKLSNLTLWFANLRPWYDLSSFTEHAMHDAKTSIIPKLHEIGKNRKPLIDLVVLVSSGDYENFEYHDRLKKIANEVVLSNLDGGTKLLFVRNCSNLPLNGSENLKKTLIDNEKKEMEWIKANTGANAHAIFCRANGMSKPYNISKLFYYMLECTPAEKRLLFYENISSNTNIWEDNDSNYSELIKKIWMETSSGELTIEELRISVIDALPQPIRHNPFFVKDYETADLSHLRDLAKSDKYIWSKLSEDVKSALTKN